MATHLKKLVATCAFAFVFVANAQIVFYENQDFQGRSITTDRPLDNFNRAGFNDRASSVIVLRDRWEVCDDVYYGGRCLVLRQGRYPSLAAMGLNDRVSSTREVHQDARFDDNRYGPEPVQPVYDSRVRDGERLYQARVSSVHAVVGPPTQRCWMEREQVAGQGELNMGAALAGALIGGVLGHQIGHGGGRDVATVGGAVVGGAIGSNVGRDNNPTTREVQRCTTTNNTARPEFWDVTYYFRGQEHRMQVTTPPGDTITVNAQGEPRI
jgi:uncharacterized protein YcfJ